MMVPGRSKVVGHKMFECLDCGAEWSAVGDDVGNCPVCPSPELRFINMLEAQSKRQAMTIPERCFVAMLLVFLCFVIIIILAVNI